MKGNSINTAKIYQFMKDNNLSKTSFCKLCKISPKTFEKIVAQNLNFGITALFKISRAMNLYIN